MKKRFKVNTTRFFIVIFTLALAGLVEFSYADGLPGEFLLSSRWRDMLSKHSPLTNPAFLTEEQYTIYRGAFSSTMQGAFKLWEAGVTVPVGLSQSIGLSAIGESDGKIESSTFDETNNRLIAGGDVSSNNNVFTMLTYAINPVGGLSIGANLNVAVQSNFGKPLTGLGLDLGCSYRVMQHSVAGNHIAGISTVNLLAPSMQSSIAPEFGGKGEYSRDLRLSVISDFMEQRIENMIDFDLRDFFANMDEFGLDSRTAQNMKALEWGVGWRLGGWFRQTLGVFLQVGFDERALEYYGMASGVKVNLAGKGSSLTMLYQYNIKTEGELASAHTFYLIVSAGKHRKEQRKAKEQKSPVPDTSESMQDSDLNSLKKIDGLKIVEEKEHVRIIAEEVAIHFESGTSEIPQQGINVLKEIAEFVRKYPGHPVRVEGHTDNDPIRGKLKSLYADNVALSKARAETVVNYLVQVEKLPQKVFTSIGYGESRPIAANHTRESKYKNRRVVIIINKIPDNQSGGVQ